MVANPSFYSVIIGTELLNGRRRDKHFEFLNKELIQRGWEHKANFVIKDDPKLIEQAFACIKSDPHAVMFSYGGIGATPDDLTRYCAANIFCDGQMESHKEAKALIVEQFGDEAYPHRINMAYLPKDAGLLDNIVNNVPGFFISERYFFVPGFPSMANAMVQQALDTFYPRTTMKTTCIIKVEAPENDLIDIMNLVPKEIEFSSLPRFLGDKRVVEMAISHTDASLVFEHFAKLKSAIEEKEITILQTKP